MRGLSVRARHGVEVGFRQIPLEILAFGEGADAERVAVGGEHRDALAHVFRRGAVHDDADAGLQLPAALAGVNDEGAAAEARHGHLEGGEGAQ